MILLYLQTQAIRTRSREVELGRSMRHWLDRMGRPKNSRWWAGPGVLMWHGGAQAAALGWSMTS